MKPTRESIVSAGSSFHEHRSKFKQFVDALLPLADVIPSLEFRERGDGWVEFSFLGRLYRIIHEFAIVDGKHASVVTSLSRGMVDETDFARKHRLLMDKHGNLGTDKADATPWNVAFESESAFYYLVGARAE